MSNGNLETRTLFDELKSLEKGWLFDFGHPLVNRIAESFVKAAGVIPSSHLIPFFLHIFVSFEI